jgi:hypothetical protein
MSRKARHLQVLEDSKSTEYNLEQPSRMKTSLLGTIKDTRDDEFKRQANLYAASLGQQQPNKLSYEKGGKRRAMSKRRGSSKRRKSIRRKLSRK